MKNWNLYVYPKDKEQRKKQKDYHEKFDTKEVAISTGEKMKGTDNQYLVMSDEEELRLEMEMNMESSDFGGDVEDYIKIYES